MLLCIQPFRLLSQRPAPWNKDAGGGYQFATGITGGTSECKVTCIPRAFLDSISLTKVEELKRLAQIACAIWPGVSFDVEVIHQYTSTKDAISANQECLGPIVAAIRNQGIAVIMQDVPAGTDGAMLNLAYPNIPAPNIGTGAHNIHQLTEFIAEDDLEKLALILADIISGFSKG